jgi:hypothetical protein
MGEWLIMVKSLVEEMQTLIQSEANNYPTPRRCTVTKVYNDGKHADIKTSIGTLTHVECYGAAPTKDCNAILLYLNEEMTDYIIII